MSCLNEVNLGVFIGPHRASPRADLGVEKVPCSSSPGDFASERKISASLFHRRGGARFFFFFWRFPSDRRSEPSGLYYSARACVSRLTAAREVLVTPALFLFYCVFFFSFSRSSHPLPKIIPIRLLEKAGKCEIVRESDVIGEIENPCF